MTDFEYLKSGDNPFVLMSYTYEDRITLNDVIKKVADGDGSVDDVLKCVGVEVSLTSDVMLELLTGVVLKQVEELIAIEAEYYAQRGGGGEGGVNYFAKLGNFANICYLSEMLHKSPNDVLKLEYAEVFWLLAYRCAKSNTEYDLKEKYKKR